MDHQMDGAHVLSGGTCFGLSQLDQWWMINLKQRMRNGNVQLHFLLQRMPRNEMDTMEWAIMMKNLLEPYRRVWTHLPFVHMPQSSIYQEDIEFVEVVTKK